jgi:hypothetical protein
MRIATCAKEAAGTSVKASNNANAIFFIVARALQVLVVSGILQSHRLVEGINVVARDYFRVHPDQYLRSFYSPGFLRDVPDCSATAFGANHATARVASMSSVSASAAAMQAARSTS